MCRFESTPSAREDITSPFNVDLKGFSQCVPFRGLSVMDDFFHRYSLRKLNRKPYSKCKQFNKFAEQLADCRDTEVLLESLSNDYKAFLTDHRGKMLQLNRTAVRRWEAMSDQSKCEYNIFAERSWTKTTRKHLMEQFGKYEDILKPVLKKSTIEVVHHSSVLERLNPNIPNLDMYFAILNSVLEYFLAKWTKNQVFKNKCGKPVICKFVSVREQFFLRSDKISVFSAGEVTGGGELTHRNEDAYDELAGMWRSKVL